MTSSRPKAGALHGIALALAAMGLGMVLLRASPAAAAASGWVGNAHAKIRLITAEQATGSSGTVDAGLEIRLAPGWHAYWRDPGAAGVPPSVAWRGSENLREAQISWPAPRRFALAGLQTYGYEGDVILPVEARLERRGGPVVLRATVEYSACRNICVPYHAVLDLALPAGIAEPGPEAPLIAAARAQVPGNLARLGLTLRQATVFPDGSARSDLRVVLIGQNAAFLRPDLFVEGLPSGAPGPPTVRIGGSPDRLTLVLPHLEVAASALTGKPLTLTLTDGPGRAATFTASPTFATRAALAAMADIPLGILAAALLGGLILNVMPCVLPVLSLKLTALTALAGAERRTVRLDLLATAAGVIAGFAVLAGVLTALKEAGAAIGWGIQFQRPWFLAAMTMVMALFAADLWGWITIGMPRVITRYAGAARISGRHANAFLAGTFATFLATSCSAPFVGSAVGFALARGPLEIIAIFLAMGLGLATPYLLGAAAPALVGLLPRPGRWTITLARVFGVFLLGTAIWLLAVLVRVSGLAAALPVGILAALLLALLAWRHVAGDRRPALRRSAAGAAAGLVAIAVLLSVAMTGERAAAVTPSSKWHPFAPAAVAENVAHGRTVFVDVTAAWCLICQVNAATVLDRNPVAAALARPGVVAMRADWTRPDAAITGYLQSFGRYGVPLDVVYGPGARNGIVLPDLVTPGEVLRALERAAGRTRSAER